MLSSEALGTIFQLFFLAGFALSLGVLTPIFIYKMFIKNRGGGFNVRKKITKKE